MRVTMDDHNDIMLSTVNLVPVRSPDTCKKITEVHNLNGDRWNLVKLLFLYILQGVPLGFSDAFPILLKSKQFSYYDQVKYTERWIERYSPRNGGVLPIIINNILIMIWRCLGDI